MIYNLAKILMEVREQTITIKSLSFFSGLIGFGIALVFTINGMINNAVEKGVAQGMKEIVLGQRLIDQKQDADIISNKNEIESVKHRVVLIENSRK